MLRTADADGWGPGADLTRQGFSGLRLLPDGQHSAAGPGMFPTGAFDIDAMGMNSTGDPSARITATFRLGAPYKPFARTSQKNAPWFQDTNVFADPAMAEANSFAVRFGGVPLNGGLNLAAVNLHLATGYGSKTEVGSRSLPSAEQIQETYRPLGVVRNDRADHVGDDGEVPGTDRIMAIGLGGPVDVQNIWPHNPVQGFRLYYILVGVPLAKIKSHKNAPTASYNVLADQPSTYIRATDVVDNIPPVVLQYIPWCHKFGTHAPSLKDLTYVDARGVPRVGIATYVGRVIQVYPKPHTRKRASYMPFSSNTQSDSGLLQIILEQSLILPTKN